MQKKSAQKWRLLINSPIGIIYQFFIDEIGFSENELSLYIEDIKTGKTPSKNIPKYFSSNDLERYKPQDIGEQMYLDETISFISNDAVINKQATIYEPGTLLINCIGDIGRCAIATKKCSSNQQITGIKFKDNLLPEFVYYFFLCNSDKLQIESSSTTLAIINQAKLGKLKIKYIEKEKQKEISAFLKHCVDSIMNHTFPQVENYKFSSEFNTFVKKVFSMYYGLGSINQITNNTNTLIKSLRQSILSDAIAGKLVPQDPTDEPASVLLSKIQAEKAQLIADKKIKKPKSLAPITEDEKPFELPQGWEWVRLGEVSNYGSCEKLDPREADIGLWILDLEDIEKDSSKILKKMYYPEREFSSTKSKFTKGQLLYSKLRPYLNKVIIADEDGVCTTEILPIKLYGEINAAFIKIVLKSSYFLNYVKEITYGIKMPRLGTEDGQIALIPLPSLAEQHRIVTKVEQLMTLCDQLEAQISDTQSQGKLLMEAVMQQAMG